MHIGAGPQCTKSRCVLVCWRLGLQADREMSYDCDGARGGVGGAGGSNDFLPTADLGIRLTFLRLAIGFVTVQADVDVSMAEKSCSTPTLRTLDAGPADIGFCCGAERRVGRKSRTIWWRVRNGGLDSSEERLWPSSISASEAALTALLWGIGRYDAFNCGHQDLMPGKYWQLRVRRNETHVAIWPRWATYYSYVLYLLADFVGSGIQAPYVATSAAALKVLSGGSGHVVTSPSGDLAPLRRDEGGGEEDGAAVFMLRLEAIILVTVEVGTNGRGCASTLRSLTEG